MIFVTIMSAFLQDWADAIIILLTIFGSALVSFSQEYRASSAVEKLCASVTFQASILRDGQGQSISTEQVVPGDLILPSAGNLIPADAIVLEAKYFFVNQAKLPVETFPVEKKPIQWPNILGTRTHQFCPYKKIIRFAIIQMSKLS